jgi:hypothetical protein
MDSPHRKRHVSSLDVRQIFVFLRNIIRKITLPLIFFWRGRIIGSLIFPCSVSRFRWSIFVQSHHILLVGGAKLYMTLLKEYVVFWLASGRGSGHG